MFQQPEADGVFVVGRVSLQGQQVTKEPFVLAAT